MERGAQASCPQVGAAWEQVLAFMRVTSSASVVAPPRSPLASLGRRSLDGGTALGVSLALLTVGAGVVLEGGRLRQLLQPTAALIVFGGTLGAVLVQFPFAVVRDAFRALSTVVFATDDSTALFIKHLSALCQKARHQGVAALEAEVRDVHDVFLKQALELVVDGTEPLRLRGIMEVELNAREEAEEQAFHVFECAGGYAPTIGILGAVVGLIQVLQHLGDPASLGRGIAAAFVATLYGVGAANLLFLPAAGKLRMRLYQRQLLRKMALEGAVCIAEGEHPRMLTLRLLAFRQREEEVRL
jgi:chemotaxis protein MotA